MKKKPLIMCRCEEITEEQIKEAILNGAWDLDAVKRATRAGMGLCQGRSCSKIIGSYIGELVGVSFVEMKQVTVRPPIRPVPINKLQKGAMMSSCVLASKLPADKYCRSS